MCPHLQLIDRGAGEQFAILPDALEHGRAQFFLYDLLHGARDEIEIALVGDVEFDLVPDVGEKRPGIIVNHRVEDLGIRELNDAAARVVARNVLPAEFPKGGVDVADIDDIAGRVFDLDAVADAIRAPDEDVIPADEAGHGGLHRESDNHGNHADGDERGVPIHENDRNPDEQNEKENDQALDSLEGESVRGIGNAGDAIERDRAGDGEKDDDDPGPAENAAGQSDMLRPERDKRCPDQIIERGAGGEKEEVRCEPKLVALLRRACLLSSRLLEGFANVVVFG